MYSLQTTVFVRDKEFHITNNGDYRMVLDCFEALNDTELSEDFRVLACLVIFYEELNDILDCNEHAEYLAELVDQMFLFFNCGRPQTIGVQANMKLMDWQKDEQIICAAVNNVAKTEIRALEYLHWWTFMGYYLSVGESILSTVVSIRSKMAKGEKLDDWEKKYRRDNPEYFTWNPKVEDKEVTDFLEKIKEGGIF